MSAFLSRLTVLTIYIHIYIILFNKGTKIVYFLSGQTPVSSCMWRNVDAVGVTSEPFLEGLTPAQKHCFSDTVFRLFIYFIIRI